ncbi:POU domain, class 6, transcription factor 1 isoform X3 [Xenopus tropicalis]|uniref:POU domain protein n=1 Tax=Xenopus tropicalis TaxID=8364 RepID=A0A8J0SEA9_XENTR|nr:POU domain, class 6, transcription factor 1 isoform X3 [Xenopus tropicalis]|eukprot:XP_012811789.1 PREDICTED: POU domain, class 6, transcription factor 1 isoform X3 [Xenopus tropicalis]
MDAGTLQQHDGSLTVNEQVIVMSGHETIRVLEVGVDAPVQSEESGKAASEPADTSDMTRDNVLCHAENTVKSTAGLVTTSIPTLFTHASSQPQPTIASFAVQPAPQVLTQENLATLVTGVMAPAGPVAQPVLIPISIGGQVAGQQGLALWNFPTATVATLPGLTTAPPAGGVFKLPLANLQAASLLNTALQAPMQAAQAIQTVYQTQPALQAQPSLQTAVQPMTTLQAASPLQGQTAVLPGTLQKAAEPQSQITVQPASFTFNPAIISAASLGGQAQLLGSLAATPIIANAIPGVQGITSQIITNTQGQVIGTLPWLLNSPGITAGAATAAVSAQNLVQTVTPQLLLNAQGQVIATLASSPIQQGAVRKQTPQDSPAHPKSEQQVIQPTPAITQPSVVVANPAPPTTSTSTQVHISCSEPPTVGQLVSKAHSGNYDDDGINLEEIREFAKEFKIRRLSLGLTQTQVGQALTATEGPAYSQSAICRFEKLDITPKSAQKLKPVLEKWLNEAEMRNQEGQQNLMEFVGGEPSKKRKRRTSFTPQAVEVLNAYFEKNSLPAGQEITDIAKELNYDREVVRVWFCNRRQTLKNTSKLNVFQIP